MGEIQRSRGTGKKKSEGREERSGGKERGGREKLEVTTDICEICLKYFKPSRDLMADLPQLIAQRIRHRTKPCS